MDHPRTTSENGDDNVGIPEYLRCKRTDGKQWRCSAMSMPDKTVCEKHYIQAKKRAANSAVRASLKKKRKSFNECDDYLDNKNDDMDIPVVKTRVVESHASAPGKKHKESIRKTRVLRSPETPPTRSFSTSIPLKPNDDPPVDISEFDEDWKSSYTTPTTSGMEPSKSRARKNLDDNALVEHSSGSTDTSNDADGKICHQCRRNDRGRVIWCMRCDRRGYCDGCISKRYPKLSLEEIQRCCPACSGTCNCKVCLRGDNLIKVRIQEIAARDKLLYLYGILSAVLPVVKQIHSEQCSELGIETRLHGTKTDIPRVKLNADEQMCCNCCRIPITDYHRHCSSCMYDLCLTCCRELQQASSDDAKGELLENQGGGKIQDEETMSNESRSFELGFNLSVQFPDWKANSDGTIPCPPKEYGGCGSSSLTLTRIFKMNWVAKLMKNVEEMVNGCKVYDVDNSQPTSLSDSSLCQAACREDQDNNFLYCPTSQDIGIEGIGRFRKHWCRGEPIIVKEVFNCTSDSTWDPMAIWSGIRETTDGKMNDDNKTVKAIDCLNWSEVDIELGQFIKGYAEGRIHENGWPEMLKLKNWPLPSASEDFLLYQRPDFIGKLPLLEYIHSKWGLLNVAAKLAHNSLQTDVGPTISISYGTFEELGRGDSVVNLHMNMRDMLYLLMHTSEVKLKGWQQTIIEKIQKSFKESDENESVGDAHTSLDESGKSPDPTPSGHAEQNEGVTSNMDEDEIMKDQTFNWDNTGKARAGALWDVFRREDVPNLIEYLRVHREEFGKHANLPDDSVKHPLYDEAVFLNKEHKIKLKEEFRIEPWTFKQNVGEAIFIPAGCPFQVRNLKSSVQLGLDFLSPESLGESVRLAEEIRCLPNDHEVKLHMLEVEKMSLYAASSAIREVQKLVLDPNVGSELGFEDPNLTARVADSLEKMIERRQIACV
ncbi:lysine-specific demethylase JMJ25-like isoform X1 [Telopea speciosissima]|uniref:lysine-specific demethylase JMJ25-like isoform X1 n=1 Tax=Telopea speciosissima TaxID=54955 RepID=UPI001CC82F64|nr:lysine-specific demethylase JMJ25-like isoform X1 [Telopea speciosissima]